jgi:4-amino-4-deoxy-L-arabinose transferase-like glycosyltransferase
MSETDAISTLGVVILIAVYLSPIVIAQRRRTRNRKRVAFLTILLGWTVVGWIAAFVAACFSQAEPRSRPTEAEHENTRFPHEH